MANIIPWPWWLAIEGKGDGKPDPANLAAGIRRAADGGEPLPSDLLRALADMLDNPKGHAGTKLKIVRARGGRRAQFDWIAVGKAAHERAATGTKLESVVHEVAQKFGCDGRTVRRALADYRIGINEGSQSPD